ncbi:MAG: transketolase [Clostridiales bacterium]|nr:transketolase [Clostridiales bacterium]
MQVKPTVAQLEDLAYELRQKLLTLCGTYAGIVHIGGDLSVADIFTALFQYGLNVNPADIAMPTRDRFILSKGHAAVCMYITMAIKGFFNFDEIVRTYGQLDSAYGMHPCKVQLPGVECSSGSLGHGLSMSIGLALSARQKKQTHRVFCLMGDGETCEGSVWEAAMAASSFKLGNLVAFVDRNHQLMTSFSEDTMTLEPYADKWRSFGWNVITCNGHSMAELVSAIDSLPAIDSQQPTAVICETIKGKGVSFMERNLGWHAGSLSEEDMQKALDEIAVGRGAR